jgi:hypothetical protein
MLTQEMANKYFEYRHGTLYWKEKTSNKSPVKVGDACGRPTKSGHIQTTVHRKLYGNHRIIFLMHHGYIPKEVDHADGNPLNNRIENLRPATRAENQYNRKINKNNTSGVKGVAWHKYKKKWVAKTNVNGKRHYLGYFDTIEDAAKLLKQFRQDNHGNFAR